MDIFDITGTADIDSIPPTAEGHVVILKFEGTAATNGVVDGKNLLLDGGADFAYTPNDILMLYCDGSNWLEAHRSAN